VQQETPPRAQPVTPPTEAPRAAPGADPSETPLRLQLEQRWTFPSGAPDRDPPAWLPRVQINQGGLCPGCPSDLAPPRGANDPWWVQGRVRYERGRAGFSFGAIGRRNDLLPLFASMPIDGDYRPPPGSTSIFDPSTATIDWHFTLGARWRVLATKDGATLDFVADAIVPLNDSRIREKSVLPRQASPMPRLGLDWRW
jgi:hypothetical protein